MKLVDGRKLAGTFGDSTWNYRGAGLIFCEHTSRRRDLGSPLLGVPEILAKCYLVSEMMRGVTPACAIGRLNAFRMLARTMVKKKREWNSLSPSVFDSTVEWLRGNYKESTVYNRAGGLVAFAAYINRMAITVGGREVRFLKCKISWRHGVRNPIRDYEDPTSEKFSKRREELFHSDIHTAIATARFEIASNPSLEPSDGYDRIRLEGLVFMLALGSRVGECCALPINAYERDSDTGLPFVRVPTEKTPEPAAVPLADLWDEAVSDAYSYLLEACASARLRALEIERRGFQFVYDKLIDNRRLKPLQNAQICQLAISGLDPNEHFLIAELKEAFDLSNKEFTSAGRFQASMVSVARPVAASAAMWIDERIAKWDWSNFSKRTPSGRLYGCGLSLMANAQIADSTIQKPGLWFREELTNFLGELLSFGAFEGEQLPFEEGRRSLRISWARLRANMLSRTGGAHSTFIDVRKFIEILRSNYNRWLEVHFSEIIDPSLDNYGDSTKKKVGRVGMPQKLSEHLFVVWEGQFNQFYSKGIIPRPILRKDFYHYLSKGDDRKTIFERLQIKGADGKIVSISPHDIRRWLTTAVLRSGPSEVAVDLWMGRTPGQSRRYDYRTATERAQFLRDRYINSDAPVQDFLGKKMIELRLKEVPEDQIEFLLKEKLRAVHFSPYGSCSSDLYTNPCGKGTACLRGFGTGEMCESFHIDPDDKVAKKSIEDLLRKNEMLLRKLEPNVDAINNSILQELGEHSQVDQHLAMIVDVVRGCRQALEIYEGTSAPRLRNANRRIRK
ncbi:hypothetical protein [Xanthomonas euroxanthea]|uniref:hypothetical protein n=1 Tax=Xanthomonas euroxanthea TaxID=2259622 RepID=UPI0011C03A88|nr:hypothetical protein [Xanthomonas euroxanthea]CAE1139589.1 hypothetical protein XTG_003737 [Xanthomonas euroxanthea]